MTTRAGKPDTQADIEVRKCLDAVPLMSFTMTAGAGSGKTTSLVNALAHIAMTRGQALRKRGQRIACITYTEIAANEIFADVGELPLFHVSTIHSFLWEIVRPFHPDIRNWVEQRLQTKIAELTEKIENKKTRPNTRTRAAQDIGRYQESISALEKVTRFTYGTGSDYIKGVLGHADIIEMVPALIVKNDLLKSLVAQRYPFVFVDESQDTTPNVVDALKSIETQCRGSFCLGFFGDPMQKIFPTGTGPIETPATWASITKTENFRCPPVVLNTINNIRAIGDGLVQTRGLRIDTDASFNGSATFFVAPIDNDRDGWLSYLREVVATETRDAGWVQSSPADVRILVLLHRMAANRLGFSSIYAAMNDKAPSSIKEGLLDGTSFAVKPFLTYLLPLVTAARAHHDFDIMVQLRANCPLLSVDALRNTTDHAKLLSQLQTDLDTLAALLSEPSMATVRDVLTFAHERHLITLEERLLRHVTATGNTPIEASGDDGDDSANEAASMTAFLACPAKQLWGYRTYIEDESPFATQQGIKGAEFDRVLVVLDDDEGAHSHFSYEKYLSLADLSDKDLENQKNKVDSVLDRTRRLFYVCCSRALRHLVVVLFTTSPSSATEKIKKLGIFPEEHVVNLESLRNSRSTAA